MLRRESMYIRLYVRLSRANYIIGNARKKRVSKRRRTDDDSKDD